MKIPEKDFQIPQTSATVQRKEKKDTEKLNEDYNFFTCENSHLLCKTCTLFQTFKLQTAFFPITPVHLSAFLALNK